MKVISFIIGIRIFINPMTPIFINIPAKIIEPAVGAVPWPSGAHVWKGQSAEWVPKPINNNQKTKTELLPVVILEISKDPEEIPKIANPKKIKIDATKR